MPFDNIAIIGAGLSGLTLALFLHQNNIHCTLYELRPPSAKATNGAIMLSPNGLRSLDAISAYARIRDKGYSFRHVTLFNNNHEVIDVYTLGDADKYGYDCLRVYRQVILDELRAMVVEAGIEVVYGKQFSHVVREEGEGVSFAFQDGEERVADLLVGADGIHSSVRRYLAPEVKPAFVPVMTVICAIPTAAIKLPTDDYPLPVSVHGEAGAFLLAPQNPDGSEVIGAVQYRTHERDKAGWDALFEDKQQLVGMMRQGYEGWNAMVRSAIDAIDEDSVFMWPFYTVPKLPTWKSERQRVVILGDAAHAIPPAAGQGVNQALEDVHSLSLLLAAARSGTRPWHECLDWWQEYRQLRLEKTTELTNELMKRRLPGWTGEGAETVDNAWVFGVRVAEDVRAWVAASR